MLVGWSWAALELCKYNAGSLFKLSPLVWYPLMTIVQICFYYYENHVMLGQGQGK